MAKFIDNNHKVFYENRIKEVSDRGKVDCYYKSLIYILSVCETTRTHFKEIFNVEDSTINLDSIQAAWQTGTSAKVTRMAFNLWNPNLLYDSEDDLENNKISIFYSPSELFCCSYAPYFWEGIKIRYPEFIKSKQNEKQLDIGKIYGYCRVGNKEQLCTHDENELNIYKLK